MVIDYYSIFECINSARFVDLKDVEYVYRLPGKSVDQAILKTRKHRPEELLVRVIPETWGDTSLGMGGMAGQTITTAHTVLVESTMTKEIIIYRGTRLYKRIHRDNIPESIRERYYGKG